MSQFQFKQVDVFSRVALKGNPVAVVLNADGLSDAQMADFARWTNLSETTFVLRPQDPQADYRLRIFTSPARTTLCRAPDVGQLPCLARSRGAAKRPGSHSGMWRGSDHDSARR